MRATTTFVDDGVIVIRLFAFALVAGLGGCTLSLDWKHHVSLRPAGDEQALRTAEKAEAARAAVSANLHYISIDIQSIFVRNPPGLLEQAVALGVEATGVLADGKTLQTVLDVRRAVGENGFLHFDAAGRVEPFLYTGRNLGLTFRFQAIPREQEQQVRGRIAALADKVKYLQPADPSEVSAGRQQWAAVMQPWAKMPAWSYDLVLYPADSTQDKNKPGEILTAARHVLLFLPPPSAPSEFRPYAKEGLIRYLKLRGNRLVWRHNGSEYEETPYVILNIVRYKRYPAEDTELRKRARMVEDLIARNSFDAATALLPELAVAINDDRIITAAEKNLERSRLDLGRAVIAAAQARAKGDGIAEAAAIGLQARRLFHLRTHFEKILYPAEIVDLDFRISRHALRLEELEKDNGVNVEGARALVGMYKESVPKAPPAEAPEPSPLAMPLPDLAKEPPPPHVVWKPPHKRWWFWSAIGAGIVGAIVGLAKSGIGGGGGPGAPWVTVPISPSTLRVAP